MDSRAVMNVASEFVHHQTEEEKYSNLHQHDDDTSSMMQHQTCDHSHEHSHHHPSHSHSHADHPHHIYNDEEKEQRPKLSVVEDNSSNGEEDEQKEQPQQSQPTSKRASRACKVLTPMAGSRAAEIQAATATAAKNREEKKQRAAKARQLKEQRSSNKRKAPSSSTKDASMTNGEDDAAPLESCSNEEADDAQTTAATVASEEDDGPGDAHHCGACEGRGTLLLCDGPCGRGFHADCMPERPDVSDSWLCSECASGEHECFICNQTGVDNVDVFLCRAKKCGKFYHKACVESHPLRGISNASGFYCPRHKCATCKQSGSARGSFYMCLRCPISYHGKNCMPNGAVYKFQEGNVMLHNTDLHTLNATTDRSNEDDPDHIAQFAEAHGIEIMQEEEPPKPAQPTIPPFNPFACTPAPSVESKPEMMMSDAIPPIVPSESTAAIQPIDHATPMDESEMNGTTPTLVVPPIHSDTSSSPSLVTPSSFTSSSSSASTSSSFSSSSSSSVTSLISIFFPSVLFAPPTTFVEFGLTRSIKADGEAFVPKEKPMKVTPPQFKRVAANLYGGFVPKPTGKADYEECMCAEQNDKCEENCINRALYMECPRKCPNGEHCRNQRISRRQYAKTAVVLTQKRGFGLIAKEDIPAGSLIIEYCGEMITDAECTRRLNETQVTGKTDYYFFKLDDDLVIDAGPIGNNARFLNHSCSPNCKTELWQIGCQKRVGIFTMIDVKKNTELTYDYNFEGFWQPGAALKCECGAANCAGTLGGKKKTKLEVAAAEAKAAASTKKSSKAKSSSNTAPAAASSSSSKKNSKVQPQKRRKIEDASAAAPVVAPSPPVKLRGPPKDRTIAMPPQPSTLNESASPASSDAASQSTESDGEDAGVDIAFSYTTAMQLE